MRKIAVLLVLFITVYLVLNFKSKKSKSVDGKTHYVEYFDGIKIAYEIHGNGDIPMVFVHGWCCDKSYWKYQIDYFKDKYDFVI